MDLINFSGLKFALEKYEVSFWTSDILVLFGKQHYKAM